MSSLVEIDPVVLEKKKFKFHQSIFAISQLSPPGKGSGSSFEQIWIPFTKGCFVPSLLESGPVVWLKVAQWFCRFFNFFNLFLLFQSYLPLEKGVALYFIKLVSSSSKDALCQVWLKSALWFLRKRFLNFFNIFLLFCNYLPLVKGVALYSKKLESPSPKDALCQVWLKLALWFLRRRWKCEKFTDDGQQANRKAHLTELSFLILPELSVFMYLRYGDSEEFCTRGLNQKCKSA